MLFGRIYVYVSDLIEESSDIMGYRSRSVVIDMKGKETISKSPDIRLTKELLTF